MPHGIRTPRPSALPWMGKNRCATAAMAALLAAWASGHGLPADVRTQAYLKRYLQDEHRLQMWRSGVVLPWLKADQVPTGLLLDIVKEPHFLSLYERFGMVAATPEEFWAFHSVFRQCRVLEGALPEADEALRNLAVEIRPDSHSAVVPVLALDIGFDRLSLLTYSKLAGREKSAEGSRFFCVTAVWPSAPAESLQLAFRPEYMIGNGRDSVSAVEISHAGISHRTGFPGSATLPRPRAPGNILCTFHFTDGTARKGLLTLDEENFAPTQLFTR